MTPSAAAVEVAVVTGASTGIGREFARRLAKRCGKVILIARDAARLEETRQEVVALGAAAEIIVCNLSERSEVERLAQQLSEIPNIEYLVNNAGFGTMGDFVDVDRQQHADMINVHVVATVLLTHAVVAGMKARGRGYIINVASMSSFMIGPGQVTYAATKASLTSFSESLQVELERTGVQVQALCPGFTRTDFHNRPQFEGFDRDTISANLWLTPEKVVDFSLKKLPSKRVVCVPGLKNQFFARLMTFRFVRIIAGKSVRKK
ncbi:SDR family oxidoreductase [Bremerella sp. JC817]|uniref:SDR family NAD(P)-dependent oxidoreductase n=1 Tax=Bremerella sp. JC817 TaxID=3231756 RepID=UPI0034591828